ncbi:MAG: hypothetical protein ACK4N5_05940 [Myxococcales bacterium]
MGGVRPTTPDAAAQLRHQLEEFRSGGAATGALARMKETARALTFRAFETRTAPSGRPWRAGKSGGGDLVQSGALRAAIRIEDRHGGFAITNRVANTKTNKLYGGSHQYGRTIRAQGYDPMRVRVFSPGGKVRRVAQYAWVKNANGKTVRGKPLYRKSAGAKPMRWRTPDGKWHSAYKIRIPPRPIVPRSGQVPAPWAAALRDAAYSRSR